MRRSADNMLFEGVAPLTLAPLPDPLLVSPPMTPLRLLLKHALLLELKEEEEEEEDEEVLLLPSRELEVPVRSEPTVARVVTADRLLKGDSLVDDPPLELPKLELFDGEGA